MCFPVEFVKHSGTVMITSENTTYYVITNYVGLKLAICNVVLLLLLLLLHVLLSRWWDMRLEHDVVWLWEERADSRNLCLKWKVLLFMLYYIDKNWYHFITVHLEWFSKFAFQEVACPVGWPNRHILEILLAHKQTLVT